MSVLRKENERTKYLIETMLNGHQKMCSIYFSDIIDC